ncbi:MAG: PKD domain-containing protein, partial [Bacteroidia bacterium]
LWATVFIVTSTADSGPGTLRQAITSANADANVPHAINFTLSAGSIITLGETPLPEITRTMVIDATTTTGWTANALGITLDATNNTANQILHIVDVPNVEIYGFQIIGGLSTSFGILINGDNADGFRIGALNKRNVINRAANTIIKVIGADNGFIQNNYLGCDVTGTFGYYGEPLTFPPNSGSGLWLTDAADGNTIGGAQVGQGNLIAGGTGLGILVGLNYDSSPGGLSGCSGNIFYGNRVGGLETLQFYYIAFWIEGNSDNNIIGGVEPGQSNDLSYSSNGFSGDGNGSQVIRIRGAEAQGNTIRGNIMTCGLGTGIGLLTPGANNDQPAPVISAFNAGSSTLTGTCETPNATIDVYLGSDCNGNFTDQIKSKAYLASTIADANGNWSVELSQFGCQVSNQYVTATATHPLNRSTGPFSDGFPIPAIAAGTGFPSASFTFVQSSNFVVEFTNTSTPGCTSLWDFGAGATSNEANPSHNFAFEDTWPVRLIVTNECGSDTLDTTVVVLKLSIDELQASNLVITAFTGGITIQSNTGFEKGTVFALYNLSGQLVGSTKLSTSKQHYVQMATQALCPGIYIINIESRHQPLARKWLKTSDF